MVINPSAGTIARASDPAAVLEQVKAAFREAPVEAEVVIDKPPVLVERAKRAGDDGFEAVIAGGGDGTLNSIANEMKDGDVAFGVLPLGTHNHFAKDVGVPLDLAEAVRALANGKVVDLPVAEVNGKLFLNFSSLGLHVEIVEDRDEQREKTGRNKWLAMAIATVRNIKDPPLLRVRIVTRERSIVRLTPSVIICNNPYQMKVFGVENASVADRRLLNVYVAKEHRPIGIAKLLLRAATGRLEAAANFEVLAMDDFAIFSREHAAASVDGEVTDSRPPYRYRIRPRPLKVVVPAK